MVEIRRSSGGWGRGRRHFPARRALPFVEAPPEEACLVLIYGGPKLGKRFTLAGETLIGRAGGNVEWLFHEEIDSRVSLAMNAGRNCISGARDNPRD